MSQPSCVTELMKRAAKKKRAEVRPALGFLALLASVGVGLNSSEAQTIPALIHQPLRCSARPHSMANAALNSSRRAKRVQGLCGPRNLSPLKWIMCSGASAIQTSVSQAISWANFR